MTKVTVTVREIKACWECRGSTDRTALDCAQSCDACLRLVSAFFMEQAAEIAGLSVHHGEGENTNWDCCDGEHIERVQNAIHKYGVTS